MRFNFSWLPDLLKYNGKNFEEYYENVFAVFKKDFIESRPYFKDKPIGLQKEPMVNNKPQTFYHMTTEEKVGAEKKKNRVIAIDRCERIKWNRAIIDSNYVGLKIFPEERNRGRKNLVIWFSEMNYVIILRKAPTYFVFITAYPVKYEHKRKALEKSYEKAKKAETASHEADSTLFLH